MKVGDKLYCHTTYYMIEVGILLFEKGKEYTIESISDGISIYTDDSHIRWWAFTKRTTNCYSDYFYTLKQTRKLKLKQIESRR